MASAESPARKVFLERVGRRAEMTPRALALRSLSSKSTSSVTYDELHDRMNHGLRHVALTDHARYIKKGARPALDILLEMAICAGAAVSMQVTDLDDEEIEGGDPRPGQKLRTFDQITRESAALAKLLQLRPGVEIVYLGDYDSELLTICLCATLQSGGALTFVDECDVDDALLEDLAASPSNTDRVYCIPTLSALSRAEKFAVQISRILSTWRTLAAAPAAFGEHIGEIHVAFSGLEEDEETRFIPWDSAPEEKYVRIPPGGRSFHVLRKNGAEAAIGALGELHSRDAIGLANLSMRARRSPDGSVAVLKEDLARQTFVNGLTAARALESAFALTEVRDAAVLKTSFDRDPVLFVALSSECQSAEQLKRSLSRRMLKKYPGVVCLVNRIPVDEAGNVDGERLTELLVDPSEPKFGISAENEQDWVVTAPEDSLNAGEVALLTGEKFEVDPLKPDTLAKALEVAARLPEHKGLRLIDAEGETGFVSYLRLYDEATEKAATLRLRGLEKGDVAILQIENQRVFFPTWWGCVLNGIRPIVVDAPATYEPKSREGDKLAGVCRMFPRATIIASKRLLGGLTAFLAQNDLPNPVCEAEAGAEGVAAPPLPDVAPDDIAFLQLTSGSTGAPKCVIETHRNIIWHIQSTTLFNDYGGDDVTLNWLPLDHVAPILMCHLTDLYNGCQQIHVQTQKIAAEPLAWLDYIEQYKVTHTWSPNFGYRLLSEELRRETERRWDLTSVRHFLNAGEQVTESVISEFVAQLSRFGVRATTMRPAYGMAELSTAITYSPDSASLHFVNDRNSLTRVEPTSREASTAIFVPVGSPIPGVSVRIVDDADRVLPHWTIGQVQASGGVVVPGYWNNGEVDTSALTADRWFRTGDQGYVGRGELVITGRKKEIIIVRGVHYHCYEMEEEVGALQSVKSGYVCCTAATDPHTGTEGVAVIFVASGLGADAVGEARRDVQRLLARRYHLSANCIVSLPEHDFPKTTSGKIQRQRLRRMVEQGAFDPVNGVVVAQDHGAPRALYALSLLPRARPPVGASKQHGRFLVIGPQEPFARQMMEALHHSGSEASFLEVAAASPMSEAEYERRLIDLVQSGEQFAAVLILLPAAPADGNGRGPGFAERHAAAFLQILAVSQALAKLRSRTLSIGSVTMTICSHVTPEESAVDLHARSIWMMGLIKSISSETDWLVVKSVEAHVATVAGAVERCMSEALSPAREEFVVYSERQRLTPALTPISADTSGPAASPLKIGGNYLITGGCSGIARLLARHLALSYQINILFVGRRPQDATIETELEWLRATGVQALYAAADVGDRILLATALRGAQQAGFGDLDGAFHLANVFDQKPFGEETPDRFHGAYAAKMLGTVEVAEFLEACNPQALLVLFSSVNAYFGGLDAATYSAVCGFQANYALSKSRPGGLDVRCLAWTPWRDVGTAKGFSADQLTLIERKGFDILDANEALRSFEEALRIPEPALYLGLNAARPTIGRCVAGAETLIERTADETATRAVHHAKGKDLTAVTPIMAALHDIWERVLGVGNLGVEDNFFERGGNSLSASRLMAEVNKELGVKLPLRQLFETPTIESLAGHVQERRIAEDHTGQKTSKESLEVLPDIEGRFEPFDLNDIQLNYWIGRESVFEMGNISAHIYLEVDVAKIDPDKLSKAIDRLVERHDMLRAIILESGQQQVLRQVAPYRLPVVDLSWMSPAQADRALESVRNEMSHYVFDTTKWPLFDIRLSVRNASSGVLHLGFDVIIADAASLQIFARELVALYEDPDRALPPIGVSFRDYLAALDRFKQTEPYEVAWEYWRNRLDTLPGAPQLPLAKDPKSIGAPTFTRQTAFLTEEESAAWGRLCDQHKLTLSAGLLTAFAHILQLWSRTDSFCINLTTFARLPLHPDIDRVIGDFTTLTPTQIDALNDRSFVDHALEVQRQLWTDLDNGFVGARVLREIVAKSANKTSAPFPVVFTSMLPTAVDAHRALSDFGNIAYMITQTPQVWLDHQVFWEDGRITFNWDTVQGLFPEGLVERMFDSYREYIRALAENDVLWLEPAPLSSLSVLRERDHLLVYEEPEGSSECLQTRFLEWARREPGRVAIVTPERVISYGALELASRRLCASLRSQGGAPGDLVAIMMQKGWAQIVAVFAALRLGAAYVPIDAATPMNRARKMVALSGARWMLTAANESHLGDFEIDVIAVSDDLLQPEAGQSTAIEEAHDSEKLAYVIFTSGSTGEPKGVAIRHGAAFNTIEDINRRFDVNGDDAVLALSSLAFDLSVYDIFGPLSVGAKIVMPDAQGLMDPAHWMAVLQEHGVTIWNSVPALMHLLTDFCERAGDEQRKSRSLRLALLSGDWIPLDLAGRIRRQFDTNVRVIGLGGATEASIWSNFHEIDEIDPAWVSIPYGRALSGQKIFVLDEMLRPCLVGVEGNIYIGGAGLADGYWKDPQRTAASFIIHPDSGRRLYATGDLGRYLADGGIEFLGRKDSQVKIRGYRVELGEIEASLTQVSSAANAVAALVDFNGKKVLAGYLVHPAKLTDNAKILEALRGILPAYMIPEFLVWLAQAPLTANGKVDRKNLPPIVGEAHSVAVNVTPSSDSLTQEVTALVSEAVGLPNLAMHDNLLEVGANSVDLVKALTALQSRFGFRIPIGKVYLNPTIDNLVALIKERTVSSTERPAAESEKKRSFGDITLVERGAPLPLSFGQERLWFMQHRSPDTVAYNESGAARLKGHVDLQTLRDSLGYVFQRHEALRTVFVAGDDDVRQRVLLASRVDLCVTDISHLTEDDQSLHLREFIKSAVREVFDLTRAPPIKAHLIKLQPQEHILLVVIHHIVADGWSVGVLVKDLVQVFDAYSRNVQPALGPLPIQYCDYAQWQREQFAEGAFEDQLAHWRRTLKGIPVLKLPLDAPRLPNRTYGGDKIDFKIDAETTRLLRQSSVKHGVPLFVSLLTAYATLLARLTGQEDFGIGTVVAGRERAEFLDVIGYFANVLVLRADFSGNPTFGNMLSRMKQVCGEAFANQEVPFEKVVEACASNRDAAVDPLWQVMFVLQNMPQETLALQGLEVEPYELDLVTAKFDLKLEIYEDGDGLRGAFVSSRDIFRRESLETFVMAWRVLVERWAHIPDEAPVARIPLAPSAEADSIRKDANTGSSGVVRTEAPSGECGVAVPDNVYDRFRIWALERPARVAVSSDAIEWTYGQLSQHVDAAAGFMKRRGVTPGGVIAIHLENCVEYIAAILAAMKLGCAYMPVDPKAPLSRLVDLLKKSRAAVLIANSNVLDSWDDAPIATLSIEDMVYSGGEVEEETRAVGSRADTPAYIIFTSGSSGRPKGVTVTHARLLNYIDGIMPRLGLPDNATMVLGSTLTGDLGHTCTFGALTTGRQLSILPPRVAIDPNAVAAYMQRAKPAFFKAVPSHLALLLTADIPKDVLPTTCLMLAGEQLTMALAKRLIELSPGLRIINSYGPTETTCGPFIHEYDSARVYTGDSVPIGAPLPNMSGFVCDEAGQPAPDNFVGELCISGVGVADGYLDDAEATANAFVQRPDKSRLYRTGDLVRLRLNGEFEFIGRKDNQIKIRGYRVELEEVERVAAAYLRERPCAACFDPEKSQLGIFVACSPEALNADEFAKYLDRHLPGYMHPSLIGFAPRLPTTVAGKVDRKALHNSMQLLQPWPKSVAASEARPESIVQQTVHDIFCAVLGVPEVDVNATFFFLGGHSLLAVKVINAIKERLHVRLPLSELFEHPTILGLSAVVEGRLASEGPQASKGLELRSVSRHGDLALSFAQERLWRMNQSVRRGAILNTAGGLRIRGPLDVPILEQSFCALIERHEAFRTSFRLSDKTPVANIVERVPWALIVRDLSTFNDDERAEEIQKAWLEQVDFEFDLQKAPLLRVVLLRSNDADHTLILSVNHIITDAASIDVLFRELAVVYEALRESRPPALPPLRFHYADFAAAQRRKLTQEHLGRQMAYWVKELRGWEYLDLCVDRAPSARLKHTGAHLRLTIDRATTSLLRLFAKNEGLTESMALLAGFFVLLYRHSGQLDITAGLPNAARDIDQLDNVMGYFVNPLAIRVMLDEHLTCGGLFQLVKEKVLAAQANVDVSFERVVDAVTERRLPGKQPVFQVVFNYVRRHRQMGLPGLEIELLDFQRGVSPYELLLHVTSGADEIDCRLEYSDELFFDDTAGTMAADYVDGLRRLMLHPEAELMDVIAPSDRLLRGELADEKESAF